jgi:hypothetical protein
MSKTQNRPTKTNLINFISEFILDDMLYEDSKTLFYSPLYLIFGHDQINEIYNTVIEEADTLDCDEEECKAFAVISAEEIFDTLDDEAKEKVKQAFYEAIRKEKEEVEKLGKMLDEARLQKQVEMLGLEF